MLTFDFLWRHGHLCAFSSSFFLQIATLCGRLREMCNHSDMFNNPKKYDKLPKIVICNREFMTK